MNLKFVFYIFSIFILSIISLLIYKYSNTKHPEFISYDSYYVNFWENELIGHLGFLQLYGNDEDKGINKLSLIFKFYQSEKNNDCGYFSSINGYVKRRSLYLFESLSEDEMEIINPDIDLNDFKKWANTEQSNTLKKENLPKPPPCWETDASLLLSEIYNKYSLEKDMEMKKALATELSDRFFKYYLSLKSNFILPSKKYEHEIALIFKKIQQENDKLLLSCLMDPLNYEGMKNKLNSYSKEFFLGDIKIKETGKIIVPDEFSSMTEKEYHSLINIFLLWCRNLPDS